MGGINCSNCRTVKSDTEFVLEDYKQTDPFEAKVKALARNSVAIGKLIRIQRLYRRHCMDRVNKSKGIAPAIKIECVTTELKEKIEDKVHSLINNIITSVPMKTYITTSEHFELTTNKSVNTLNNTLGRDFTFEQCDLTVTNQAPQTNLLAKSIESFYIKKSYENNRYSINTITTQQEQPCRNKLIADLQNVEGFSLNSSINLHQQENLNIHHDYKSLHDELVENFSINKKNGARTYVADESENKSEVFSSISCKKKKVITVMKRIIKNIPAKSQERINLQVQRCFKLYSLVKEKTRKKSHIKLRNYFKIWLQHSNVKFNQKKKKVKDYFFRIKKIFENKTLYFALSRLRKISDRKEFENILRCKILKNLLIHLGRINLAYSFNKFSRNSLKSQKKIKVTTATMYQFHKIIIGFLFKRRLFLLAKIFSRWKMENFVIKNQKYLRLAYSQAIGKVENLFKRNCFESLKQENLIDKVTKVKTVASVIERTKEILNRFFGVLIHKQYEKFFTNIKRKFKWENPKISYYNIKFTPKKGNKVINFVKKKIQKNFLWKFLWSLKYYFVLYRMNVQKLQEKEMKETSERWTISEDKHRSLN